jgi:ankyrin repeat protein
MSSFINIDESLFVRLFDSGFIERHEILANLFDLNIVFEGRTLLHRALEAEDVHLVTAILRFGADPNLRSGNISILPLGIAINQGRGDFVQILVAFGARTDYAKSEVEPETINFEISRGDYQHRLKMMI